MAYDYDLIIIGSGSGATSAAESAKEAGAKRVAVVEGRERLGGECPNRGCVPTKVLLRSVANLQEIRRANEFGVMAAQPTFDFRRIMARQSRIVDALTKPPRLENLMASLGVNVLRGWAEFKSKNEITAGGKSYSAKAFLVATGSENVVPSVAGLNEAGYITSDDLVGFKSLPKSIIILGGGPIGTESAQILAPLGVKVTIVEFAPHILPREEPEIADVVTKSLQKQGVQILTNTKMLKVEKNRNQYNATIASSKEGPARTKAIRAELLMVAAGKRPAIGNLGLAKIGVEIDKRGAPVLNHYLQSSVPNIYFSGDAAGQMLFTHVAHYQGELAAKNAVLGNSLKSNLSVVPRGTFTTPEVGSVGMTEAEAREKGLPVAVGRVPYAYFGKALVSGEIDGLVKIVVNQKTKMVLGGHIVGASASDLVHEIALAMQAKIPYTTIADMIHAYPTFAEAIGAAAYDAKEKSKV